MGARIDPKIVAAVQQALPGGVDQAELHQLMDHVREQLRQAPDPVTAGEVLGDYLDETVGTELTGDVRKYLQTNDGCPLLGTQVVAGLAADEVNSRLRAAIEHIATAVKASNDPLLRAVDPFSLTVTNEEGEPCIAFRAMDGIHGRRGDASSSALVALLADDPRLARIQVGLRAPPPFSDRFDRGMRADGATRPSRLVINGVPARFADIQNLSVKITVDAAAGTLSGNAVVDFEQRGQGFPVIDLVPEPTQVTVDGFRVGKEKYALHELPDSAGSHSRILEKELAPGAHRMAVTYAVQSQNAGPPLVQAGPDGARFFPALNDYDSAGRGFLERFAPASLEGNQHPVALEIEILNTGTGYTVIANTPNVVERERGRFAMEFPAHTTSSSIFVDVFPTATMTLGRGRFSSSSGREVPLVAYGQRGRVNEGQIDAALVAAKKHLADLEALFGPYPHPQLILRLDDGAMEYAGAVQIPRDPAHSLFLHELVHQWFGRGVMPADGQAGWIDEGIAYWVHHGRRTVVEELGAVNVYLPLATPFDNQRKTFSNNAMVSGEQLMASLDGILAADGGLTPRLHRLVEQYQHQPLSVPQFMTFLRANAPPDTHDAIHRLFALFGYDEHGLAIDRHR